MSATSDESHPRTSLLGRSVAIALLLIPAAALVVLVTFVVLLGWGRGRSAAEQRAIATYWEGHRLYDAGRYAEAAECYRHSMEQWGGNSDTVALLGYTLHRAGRTAEGEPLIDKAIAMRPRAHYAVYKAHVLAATSGVDAALAWLAAAPLVGADCHEALASFHRERGEHAAALPALRAWLAAAPGMRYVSADGLQVPTPIDYAIHNDVASLLDPLRDLADSELHTGDHAAADRSAALGIAVGQVLNRDTAHAGADYGPAGDVGCRVVRARVAIAGAQWDAAAEHLRLARVITSGSYSSWRRHVEAAEAELAAQRPPR